MPGKAQRGGRQTRLQNSGITGPKFTKFFSDVEKSSVVFILRSSYSSWNAQNKSRVCQFSPIGAKNRLP